MTDLYLYIQKSQKIRYMQKRHTDRKMYFRDLEITSKEFYISYLSDFTELTPKSRILEVGCGEGGNLVPFAQLGCKVTGIDIAECRIKDAKAYFSGRQTLPKSAIMLHLYAVISCNILFHVMKRINMT